MTGAERFRSGWPEGSTVLVTGATGFTGRRLVERLVKEGVSVRATARPGSAVSSLAHLPIRWFTGALHDEALVREAVAGAEYIVHLASNYRQRHESEQEHHRVHVTSTQLLARAALAQHAFRRFVHISSVGVHGHIERPPASETYPFAPGDVYQRTKLEGEQWIRAFGRTTGLPIVVIRPAAIYGPGDRRLYKVFWLASWPVVPLIGHGRRLYHLVHVDDLVEFILLAAAHPRAVGEVFICASRHPISIEAFIRQAGRCYGVENRFVRLPVAPVMALAVACERMSRWLRIPPPLDPRRVAFFTKDRAFDTTKMSRLLGFSLRRDDRTGIEDTARWYVEAGWIRPRPWMRR